MGERIPELLRNPGRRRMGGDGGVNESVGTTNRSAAMIWLA